MLLSILIPTLQRRRPLFSALKERLRQQIAEANLESQVEILWLCDDGEQPTGAKRNELLARAAGEFVVFVDDDDEVHSKYVVLICRAIQSRPDIDCIGIKGCQTYRGSHPRIFIHSVRYQDYSSEGGVYTRPPYHLNPIRRSIAAAYRFREIYYSEDIDWALRIRKELRSEEFIEPTLYYYRSRRHWQYQWLLDRTETVRHRFGIRLTNRFQIYSKLRRAIGFDPKETA
jgi:glycosyltransferase involved in cell wall biosynthesis